MAKSKHTAVKSYHAVYEVRPKWRKNCLCSCTCISEWNTKHAEKNCFNLQGSTVIEKSYTTNPFKNKDRVIYNEESTGILWKLKLDHNLLMYEIVRNKTSKIKCQ